MSPFSATESFWCEMGCFLLVLKFVWNQLCSLTQFNGGFKFGKFILFWCVKQDWPFYLCICLHNKVFLYLKDTEPLYHSLMYSLVSPFFPVSIHYLQCIHCLLHQMLEIFEPAVVAGWYLCPLMESILLTWIITHLIPIEFW